MQKILKRKIIKVGILGGTFDPPHKGHVHISRVALKKLKLDKIIWIITKKNPFKKKPYLSLKSRISLCKKITNREKKIYIKFLDNKIKSNNTYSLLKYIQKKEPKKNLYFLMGADNLKKFHYWNNWKKIPNLAKIVVFARQNYYIKSIATKKLSKKDWVYINSKKVNISSTLIRKFW